MDTKKSNWQFLNATTLKLIAATLMFIDHIHEMFSHVGAPIWLTMIGRLVFPMFLFAASESFHYTHSKKRYLLRLLIASWFMTTFTFVLQGILPNDNVALMNNAFSTFFVSGLYMLFWDIFVDGIHQKSILKIIGAILLCFIPVLLSMPVLIGGFLVANEDISPDIVRYIAIFSLYLPSILIVEGSYFSVLLGLLFYIFRKDRVLQIAVLVAMSAYIFITGDRIQSIMIFAAVPIALYNGEKGKGIKNFFYIFYPLHIGILYVIEAGTNKKNNKQKKHLTL